MIFLTWTSAPFLLISDFRCSTVRGLIMFFVLHNTPNSMWEWSVVPTLYFYKSKVIRQQDVFSCPAGKRRRSMKKHCLGGSMFKNLYKPFSSNGITRDVTVTYAINTNTPAIMLWYSCGAVMCGYVTYCFQTCSRVD